MLYKVDFHPREFGKPRPYRLIWGAKDSENLEREKPTNTLMMLEITSPKL